MFCKGLSPYMAERSNWLTYERVTLHLRHTIYLGISQCNRFTIRSKMKFEVRKNLSTYISTKTPSSETDETWPKCRPTKLQQNEMSGK